MSSCVFPLSGLREVAPSVVQPEQQGQTFVIKTGGTPSTLQEIKLPDGAGGFTYASPSLGNRFIAWRTSHDVLQLTETSLDKRMSGGRVSYKFQDTPILSGGVTLWETFNAVVVLVPTVSSVHKMVFPHPDRIRRQMGGASEAVSVFSEAGPAHAQEWSHVLPSVGTAPMPHLAASYLSEAREEAIFALANTAGSITVYKMENIKSLISTLTLKSGSYFGRLWGNLGGGGSEGGSETVLSLALHPVGPDVYVYGLSRDHNLRMWSASSGDCVLVEDVHQLGGGTQGGGSDRLRQGSQSHQMRKIVEHTEEGKESGFALALFLSFMEHSQFVVVRPRMGNGAYHLQHLATIYAPTNDLVDYSASSTHLLALWTEPTGEPVLRYATFARPSSATSGLDSGWISVNLESPPDPEFSPGSGEQSDPRAAYIRQLFQTGRFSLHTLAKAVSIYRRSVDFHSYLNDPDLCASKLRADFTSAVEDEIHSMASNCDEVTDEEYVAMAGRAWARIYSCALQYHQAEVKACGLILDGRTGLIVLIKSARLSFVRPVSALERLSLCSDDDFVPPVHAHELLADTPLGEGGSDPGLAQDVVALMRAVGVVGEALTAEEEASFAHSISRLHSPDSIGRHLVRQLLQRAYDGDTEGTGAAKLTQDLSTRLQQVGDVARALEALLRLLELDRGVVAHRAGQAGAGDDDMMMEEDEDEEDAVVAAFAAEMGTSVVAEALRQFARSRFEISRNVVLLQLLMLEVEKSGSGAATDLKSTLLPRSVVLTHCYSVLVWITECQATEPQASSLEQSLRQMAVLKVSESARFNFTKMASLASAAASTVSRTVSLSELFLRCSGLTRARSLLPSVQQTGGSWTGVLRPVVDVAAQLLWPKCKIPAFQEFLLATCQHSQTQEYYRLLSSWCDWRCHSRQFLLGSALLSMGEPEKASDWMVQASEGITTDPFLHRMLFSSEPDVTPERLPVLYFLKVIALFEQHGCADVIVELAKTAIDICDDTDPNRTILCFILFSQHLKLGHASAAYDAMILNPDVSKRKDSLRQFVVTLFERRQLRTLASFPYIDMHEDLEAIIEARARSVDLSRDHSYYAFLFSFHTSKENYRKAAHVMYECGMRLATEVGTPDGVKRQAKCYLACLNCLRLVSDKYQWIVKPLPFTAVAPEKPDLPFGTSPKHTFDGEEVDRSSAAGQRGSRPKMEVLELADIEKEFELISARLKLVSGKHSSGSSGPHITGPGLSASETQALLTSANLYHDALHISSLFSLDVRPVLEGLTSQCLKLAATRGAGGAEWLSENNVSELDLLGGEREGGSVVDAAWRLLEVYLGRLERPGESGLHKAVAKRLFSQGAAMPAWMVASYKKVNPSELLRLYLHRGYLEDSAHLALEYVSAVLGSGKEYFGLREALNVTCGGAWLPFNLLDQLLRELRDHSDVKVYAKLYDDLSTQLDVYLTTAERVSNDMLR